MTDSTNYYKGDFASESQEKASDLFTELLMEGTNRKVRLLVEVASKEAPMPCWVREYDPQTDLLKLRLLNPETNEWVTAYVDGNLASVEVNGVSWGPLQSAVVEAA